MLYDTAPFYAGSRISEPRYFIGYQEQLDTITARAVADQPTSINVVGDKRSGKSSLLCHFCQTYEQRIESRGKYPRKYLAVYLSLQQGNCQQKSGFYRVVAEELSKNLKQKKHDWLRKPRKLIDALRTHNFDTESFYQAIVQFRDVDILPIICLDKFEALFENSEEFNNGFYDNLRSLVGDSALMLVIASEKNLTVYSKKKKLTSSFFNHSQVIMLEGFTENEARDLVRLPETTIPGSKAVLSKNEQQTALDWGGKNPYLLQLAGLYLWEAKKSNTNKDINWAKKRFDRQAKGISANHSIWHKSLLFLKWVFCDLPVRLGQTTQFIGTNIDKLAAWIIGFAIVGFFILAALGILNWDILIEVLKKALGIGE